MRLVMFRGLVDNLISMKPTAVDNSNVVTAGFDSAVGPAFSVFESNRQINLSILPSRWSERISVDPVTHCWNWLGLVDREGYGRTRSNLNGKRVFAHRVVYALIFDDIDSAPVLDHRCHEADVSCQGGKECKHRRCVNPLHLVPTTVLDNNTRGRRWKPVEQRKTHCVNGHPFTEENTIIVPPGGRQCKTCRRASLRRWYVKKFGDYRSPNYEVGAQKLKKPLKLVEGA